MASETRTGVEEQPGRAASPKRPGRFRFWVRTELDEEVDEELLTPAVIRGWAVSFVVHLFVLVMLAFTILKPPPKPPNEISTTLAGDEHGSMLSDQFSGGAGIDDPLLMPKVSEIAPTPKPSLPVAGNLAPNPDLTSPNKPSSGQDGASLTGSNQGAQATVSEWPGSGTGVRISTGSR